MASAERMGPAQHHNLLVVEPHAVEDFPEGGRRLGRGSRIRLTWAPRAWGEYAMGHHDSQIPHIMGHKDAEKKCLCDYVSSDNILCRV